MTDNKLSIVFGFRDRGLQRVQRCLDSLSKQSSTNFEVLFVDYGSHIDLAGKIKQLVESYTFCRYIYSDTRGWPWNRSKALNIGIRSAKGKYILTSDVDLIFDKHIVEKLMTDIKPNSALHVSCYYLPEHFDQWGDLDKDRGTYQLPSSSALGLLCIEKEVLASIGGYDEYYQFWGREDADLESRLHQLGYETQWLNLEVCPVYHQWHPVNNHETTSFMPTGYWEKAQFYYVTNISNLIRNKKEWGDIVAMEDRVALQYLSERNANVYIDGSLSKEKLIETLIGELTTLKHGEALMLQDDFIQPNAKNYRMFNFFNRILKKLGCRFFFIYEENIIKNIFFQLLNEYRDEILDFVIQDDGKSQKYVLVKK